MNRQSTTSRAPRCRVSPLSLTSDELDAIRYKRDHCTDSASGMHIDGVQDGTKVQDSHEIDLTSRIDALLRINDAVVARTTVYSHYSTVVSVACSPRCCPPFIPYLPVHLNTRQVTGLCTEN